MDRRVNIFRDLEVTDHTDVRGRLIAEDAASPEHINRVIANGISMRSAVAHYPETRFGRRINTGALKSMADSWVGLTNGLVWLNQQYFDGKSPVDAIKGRDFSQLTIIGSALPMFLVLRKDQPFDRYDQIPTTAALISKACRGLAQAADLYKPKEEVTFKDVRADVENNELFDSPNGLVCAAPWRMIEGAFSGLCLGLGGDGKSDLPTYVSDFTQLARFSNVYTEALNVRKQIIEKTQEKKGSDEKFGYDSGRAYDWRTYCEDQKIKIEALHQQLNASLGWGDSK